MKTICFVNTTKTWGGGEKWHFETALFLKQQGFEVLLITGQNSELARRATKEDLAVREIAVTNLSFLNPLKYREIGKILAYATPDIVVLNSPIDIKTAGVAAAAKNIPHIIYRRGSDIPIKDSFLNRYYFKNIITEIIANSQATKRSILKNNPQLFPKQKIKVIYNGLDVEKFKVMASRKDSPFIIANLGRMVYQKNQKVLIDLAAMLAQELESFKIRIGGDGPLMQELKTYAEEKKVSRLVEFPGEIKDPVAFLNGIDVFVLPSHWEGFGYVLAEASLLEKPVIAFEVSSNPELIKHEETGYLVEKGNLEAMKDSIVQLHASAELRAKFGKSGREYILQNFDAQKNRQQTLNYLLKLQKNEN